MNQGQTTTATPAAATVPGRTTFIRKPDARVRSCDLPGHAGKAATAIGVDGVARCLFCSFDYELAQPLPVLG